LPSNENRPISKAVTQQKSMSNKSKLVVATAIAILGLSAQAFAAGSGLGLNGEFGGVRAASGFHSPVFNSAPPPVFNTPAPVFNPSEPYTVPESRETPVSPASPGSVFGNG
jgi:hypothetical protein